MKVVGIVLGSIFGVIVLLGIVAVNGSRRAHDRVPDGADRTTAFVNRSRTRRGGRSYARTNDARRGPRSSRTSATIRGVSSASAPFS